MTGSEVTPRQTSLRGVQYVVLVLLVLLAVVAARASYTRRSAAQIELVYGLIALAVTIPAIGAARRTRGRLRFSWVSLGLAMFLWGANLLLLDVTTLVYGRQHAVGLASLMQAIAMGLVLVTLPLQPREPWRPDTATRTRLDVAVIVLCLLLIYSVVIARHVLEESVDPVLQGFALGYPVATLGMAAFAYTRCRRGMERPRLDQMLLVVGFGCLVVSGSSFALTATRFDVSPPLVSCVSSYGILALGLAARMVGRSAVVPSVSERSARVLTSLPEALVVLATLIGMGRGLRTWADWSLAALAGLAIFLRSTRLAMQARRSRETLEREVVDRTTAFAQLAERHTRILGTVDDGIIGVDDTDAITFVNTAAERMLGLDAADVLGHPVCEVLCVGEHDACPWRNDGLTGSQRIETRFRTTGGGHVPVEVTIARRRESREGPGAAVIAFRDISDQERVEQLKRQFISSVSHELRTPLTSIRGVLEMLSDGDAGELPAEARQLLGTAQRGGERLSRLVDDIIDMERLAAGDFGVVPEPTLIDPLVRHAIASMEGLASMHGVQVQTGSLAGFAHCDPDRVEQALVNLIGNAVKFSPEGSVVLVSAEEREDEVLICVRDEGRGIPAADLPHVFERFHQVSVTDASDKGGSGLGLTITRSIVEHHGGRIWVQSLEGAGSAFSFTLPAVASASGRPLAPELRYEDVPVG
jgi:PAS domain S-box-containing protein